MTAMSSCDIHGGKGNRCACTADLHPKAWIKSAVHALYTSLSLLRVVKCCKCSYSTAPLRVTSVSRLQQLLDNTVGCQRGMFCASWPSSTYIYQGAGPDSFTSSPGYMPHAQHRIDHSSSRLDSMLTPQRSSSHAGLQPDHTSLQTSDYANPKRPSLVAVSSAQLQRDRTERWIAVQPSGSYRPQKPQEAARNVVYAV